LIKVDEDEFRMSEDEIRMFSLSSMSQEDLEAFDRLMDSQYDPGDAEADEPEYFAAALGAVAGGFASASTGGWVEGQAPYLVRGAYLRCHYGSHMRKLELHNGHGFFIGKDPMANAMDCIPGEWPANIPPFGVCLAPKGPEGVASVLLKAEKSNPVTGQPYRDINGKVIKMDDSIRGLPCMAEFVESWQNPHQETLVGMANETPYEAITMESFLVCKYLGLVEPVTSGQSPLEPARAEPMAADGPGANGTPYDERPQTPPWATRINSGICTEADYWAALDYFFLGEVSDWEDADEREAAQAIAVALSDQRVPFMWGLREAGYDIPYDWTFHEKLGFAGRYLAERDAAESQRDKNRINTKANNPNFDYHFLTDVNLALHLTLEQRKEALAIFEGSDYHTRPLQDYYTKLRSVEGSGLRDWSQDDIHRLIMKTTFAYSGAEVGTSGHELFALAASLGVLDTAYRVGTIGESFRALQDSVKAWQQTRANQAIQQGIHNSVSDIAPSQVDTPAATRAPTGEWVTVNEHMNDAPRAYQTQVTGRTGQAWVENGVKFDGMKDGRLIEAKGDYSGFVDKEGKLYWWFSKEQSLIDQAERQLGAAQGTPVDWYIANEPSMKIIEEIITREGHTEINFVLLPPQ
jgi:hypothetical protein